MIATILYFAIGALILVFLYNKFIAPLIFINAKKREYQNMAEPRLMVQVGEEDDEFFERVSRERARFVDAKNRWAEKQNPVIAIWHNQAFTITWFGEDHDVSTVGLTQMEYHRVAHQKYIELYEIWCRKTRKQFGEEQVAAANGQRPFNPEENIWQFN